MGEARLHVVSGTGQAGSALAAQLAGLGVAIRAVSRHRPVTLAGGTDWRAADAADPEVGADAAKGASVVVLENLCGYGPAGGKAGTPREKEKGHESH